MAKPGKKKNKAIKADMPEQGTSKAAASRGERESTGRVKVGNLPKEVRALVSAAQNRLRLRIALKTAWTKETSVPSARLPTSDGMIAASIRDTVRDSKGKPRGSAIKQASKLLKDQQGVDNTATETLRRNVYSAVRASFYLISFTTCMSYVRSGRAPRKRATS